LSDRDPTAWEELDEKYREPIIRRLRFLGLRLAEDAWQEVMQKFLRDPSRLVEAINRDQDIGSWLRTAVQNQLYSLHRKEDRHQERVSPGNDQPDEAIAPTPPPSKQLLRAECAERVHAAIKKLPDKYKLVIELSYFEGWSLAEIARDQGISENTIRTWHKRAKELLGKLLGGDGDD
jgi:RNA polymerase sigma-70 factor (ECF subfamily)